MRRKTGWGKVKLDTAAITLKPGMALTLNGIGQGYVADRIAALLEAEGLTNILIDTGEPRALGSKPEGSGATGQGWPVRLETGERLSLRQCALATSAPWARLSTRPDETAISSIPQPGCLRRQIGAWFRPRPPRRRSPTHW